MRRPALILIVALAAALSWTSIVPKALAEAVAEAAAEGPAIRGVIADQLAAFGRDDGAGAFAFASPGIQSRFQTPEIFLDMVRRHYAPVYRPQEVIFRALQASPRGPVQEVLFVGPDGQAVIGYYIMERQPDGSWKIDGVRLIPAPDLTI